ncbi:MAG: lysozyme inhibitor LprI family protein, partial [Leptospirales bacterium]
MTKKHAAQLSGLAVALFVIAACGCSGQAQAAADGSHTYRACVDASDGDLTVMRDCGIAEQAHWDAQRKAVYDRMLGSGRLDSKVKNRLQAVQAAWDQFQRLNCWFECPGFP